MTRETSFKCSAFSGLCIQFFDSLDILVTLFASARTTLSNVARTQRGTIGGTISGGVERETQTAFPSLNLMSMPSAFNFERKKEIIFKEKQNEEWKTTILEGKSARLELQNCGS